MNIAIIVDSLLPALHYGGTQRVVWSLARELSQMGHKITFIAMPGSYCPFARIIELDSSRPLSVQIPKDVDIAHFHVGRGIFSEEQMAQIGVPVVTTIHGNVSGQIGQNTIFVSRDHAKRHAMECYIYNGLDWDDYAPPRLNLKPSQRTHFHFLAKAAWRLKNVQGAIEMVRRMDGGRLRVLGGSRLNFKMGFRFTLSPRISFFGMVNQQQKGELIGDSRGLIFPVKWHEPFGLALTESLWFGTPVFGTPYGSLPELIPPQVGALSNNASELCERMASWGEYSPNVCHQYARDLFNSRIMAERYLACYETVLAGKWLNKATSTACNTAQRLDFFL